MILKTYIKQTRGFLKHEDLSGRSLNDLEKSV